MINGLKTILTRKMFMQHVLSLLRRSISKKALLVWILTVFGTMYFIGIDLVYKPVMLYVYQNDTFGQITDKRCEFKSLIYYQIIVKGLEYNGSGYQRELCDRVKKGTVVKVYYSKANLNIMTLREPYKEFTEACSSLICILLLIPALFTKMFCNFTDKKNF